MRRAFQFTIFNLVLVTLLLLVFFLGAGFAAEGAESAVSHAVNAAQLKDFGWRLFNFAIVFALLAWVAKKVNVKGILSARQESVQKALRDAAEAREAAERKHQEYSKKLEEASHEVEEIYNIIKREAELGKNRILAEAGATTERIKEQAARAVQQEVQKARMELREEAARLAVEMAARMLEEKIGKDDQERFLNEFVKEYLTNAEKSH